MPQIVVGNDNGGSSDLRTVNDTSWATARNAAAADSEQTSQAAVISRKDGASDFSISRSTTPFLLTALPTNVNVDSATFTFSYSDLGGGVSDADTVDLDVVLLSSMGDETDAGVADYNKFGTTVGGSIAFSAITEGTNDITLNATALEWIKDAAGTWLRLGIRNSADTDNSEPTGVNLIDAISVNNSTITINYTLLDDIVGLYLA